MENTPSLRMIWQHLLDSGGYSIGQFSITVEGDHVRVFHYGTKRVHYLQKETSYDEMENLCIQRGYNLSYLLRNYYPKSFRSLTSYKTARR